jgi:hypothetical protein
MQRLDDRRRASRQDPADIGSRRKRARTRADELPSGRLVVEVHRHLVAVIDGVIHDTWYCAGAGRRPVSGYYTARAS